MRAIHGATFLVGLLFAFDSAAQGRVCKAFSCGFLAGGSLLRLVTEGRR